MFARTSLAARYGPSPTLEVQSAIDLIALQRLVVGLLNYIEATPSVRGGEWRFETTGPSPFTSRRLLPMLEPIMQS
jgi:hypothetical protein